MSADPQDIFNAESILARSAAERGPKRPNSRAFSYSRFLNGSSSAIRSNIAALEAAGALLLVDCQVSWLFSEPSRLEVQSWKRLLPASVNEDGSFDRASAAANSTAGFIVSTIPARFQKGGIPLFFGDFIDRARFLALGENSFVESAWARASLDLCKADASLRHERGHPLATWSLLDEALSNPLSPLRSIPHKDLAIFDKARLAANMPPPKDPKAARLALAHELSAFLAKNIQQAHADGLLTHANIEVAVDSCGAILIASSHFIAAHDDPLSIAACPASEALALRIDPLPKPGPMRAFAALVRRGPLAPSKDVVFEKAWRAVAGGIAVKDAELRYRRGIPTPPKLTSSQERFELSASVHAPNSPAPKRRHAL